MWLNVSQCEFLCFNLIIVTLNITIVTLYPTIKLYYFLICLNISKFECICLNVTLYLKMQIYISQSGLTFHNLNLCIYLTMS